MIARSPADLDAYAQRVHAAVDAEVPEYAALADDDVFAVNRRNVELYFRMLAEERVPEPGELAEIEVAARRRLHQGIPLEAIFHSYHIGLRVMWGCLLERAQGLDLGHLAVLTMAYAERVSHVAARAYLDERDRVSRSQEEARRLFFTRLYSGDFADEAGALREARALGYDLGRPHVVVLATSAPDVALAETRDGLERAFPDCPAVLMRAGLVVAVPGEAVSDVLAALGHDRRLTAGVGTPRAGIQGLTASLHEARRALALGRILHPGRTAYRYDELRIFDLFREGAAVDAFVTEVLGPLLGRPHYLETLGALFAAALNRKAAAHALGVHANTLSYRLSRIEALLGGSLQDGEVCFRLQLALKLLPLVREPR
jgi:hypothetical protein